MSRISGSWEKYYATLKQLPEKFEQPASFVVEALPAFKHQKTRRMLDLGSGAGRHSVFLAKNDFDVVGIDVSKSALKIAKKWARKEELKNAAFVQATMTHVPFGDCQFDAVISVSVIHHALQRDIAKTIDEIHRILNKDGVILANLASLKDPRYGTGEWVETCTFRISEAFEEKRFEELHHFFTRHQVSKLFASFARAEVKMLKDKPHYWKIKAVK